MNEKFVKFIGNDESIILDLNYVFTHIRNIGLSAGILVIALSLIKGSDENSFLSFLDAPSGYAILLLGVVLATLNFIHFTMISMNKISPKTPVILILIISIALTIWVTVLANKVLIHWIKLIGS